jgi:hypothetical protein
MEIPALLTRLRELANDVQADQILRGLEEVSGVRTTLDARLAELETLRETVHGLSAALDDARAELASLADEMRHFRLTNNL